MFTNESNNPAKKFRTRYANLLAIAVFAWMGVASPLFAHDHNHHHGAAGLSRQEKIEHILEDFRSHGQARSAEPCSQCVELEEMSIMFDSDVSEEDVQQVLDTVPDEMLPDETMPRFQPHSFWFNTATDGFVEQGTPFTITYSFVPDGTIVTTSWNPDPTGSTLFSVMNGNFPGGEAAWKAKFSEAFNRWGEFTNITYVEVSDDGAEWGAPGELGARGDVRIAMTPLGSPLAVNYYPLFGGDMVLDSNDIGTFTNSLNDFRSLRNTLMHEHGHGLGLKHNTSTNSRQLMEPFLDTIIDGPQEDDIRGAQFFYGDWAEWNDDFLNNEFLNPTLSSASSAGTMTIEVDDVSIEREGATDWYGFGRNPNTAIAIRLEPVGTTYNQAPQDDPTNVTTVNAKAARNLGFRLYRRVSPSTIHMELLADVNANGAGEAEYHAPVNYSYRFGYLLVEVYAEDGINDVQRYKLTISNAAIAGADQGTGGNTGGNTGEENNNAPEMSVYDVGDRVDDGDTVQFGAIEIGESVVKTLSIVNTGDSNLSLGQPSVVGFGAADYSVGLPFTQAVPNSSVGLNINFTPQTAGLRQAVITIPNNDPNQSDFSFIVSGLGLEASEPLMEVTADGEFVADNGVHDLGDLEVGQTYEIDLLVENNGNAPLTINNTIVVGTQTTADADVLTQFPRTINVGQSDIVTVSLTVTAEETQTARISMLNNSANAAYVVNLIANGAPSEEAPGDDENDGGNDDDDDDEENEDEKDEDDDKEENEDDNNCGTGSAMPLMITMLSLCGTGVSRRRRRN